MELLGERLKRLREERGLSAARLGALAGIGEGAVFKIESGATKQPEFVTGARLARALGVSADYLAGIDREVIDREVSEQQSEAMGIGIALREGLLALIGVLAQAEGLDRSVRERLKAVQKQVEGGARA